MDFTDHSSVLGQRSAEIISNQFNPRVVSNTTCVTTRVMSKLLGEEIATVKSNEPSWSDGCRKVRAKENELHQVISGVENHAAGQRRELSKYHLSSHEIEDCTGAKRRVYLEPLASRVVEVYS